MRASTIGFFLALGIFVKLDNFVDEVVSNFVIETASQSLSTSYFATRNDYFLLLTFATCAAKQKTFKFPINIENVLKL